MELQQPTFEELELLAETAQLLAVLDLDQVVGQVVELAGRAVSASKTSLFLHQGGSVDWDHLLTSRDLSPDESVRVVQQVLGDGFAGWVYRNRRGDIINDTLQDPRWIVFENDPIPVRSALCVPLLHNDEVVAVLTLVHPEPYHFTQNSLRLMNIVASQFTIAIRNAQLFQHARAQRRQLRTILQSVRDVLLVLDEQGQVMLLSEPALGLLGVAEQQKAIGQALGRLEQMDEALQPVIDIISGSSSEQNWSFETRSEARQRDFQVMMSRWSDRPQGGSGYVVVMHDVTTLRDLHRFKDEMLRVVSHDLRSPLALITGYVDMILMDTPDEESPVHGYVEVIKRTTERMSGLLDDLLRVERIRSSPLELYEQTDLAQIVKVALVNTRPLATGRGLSLQAEVELEGLPRVVADPVLIRQSMENLIGNAVKYTQEGGVITVAARYDEGSFHFSVRDTGVGIPEEHLPYIFESFYRVENQLQQKGSGLGLSLVKTVIERHQGEVWVESQPGTGSHFGFRLPLG